MAAERGELQTLQIGRGLAALAVVVFHATGVIGLPKYFGVDVAPWTRAGDSGVDYFFVLSGFVMIIAHWDQIGDGRPLAFWWRRVRRLVPALWVVAALSLAAQSVMGMPPVGPWDTFNAFFILPTEHERLLAVEWTLRHEVIFYALFGVLMWRRTLGAVLLVLWVLAGLVGLSTGLKFPAAFWFNAVHLHFGLGCLIGVLFRRDLLASVPTWGVQLLWIGGGVLFAAVWTVFCLDPAASPVLRPAGYGLAAALLILGLATLERRIAMKVWKPLLWLGDASYSIYLTHFLLLSALAKVAVRLDAQASLSPVVWWVFVVVGSVVGGLVFYRLVEQPLLKLIPGRLPRWRPLAKSA